MADARLEVLFELNSKLDGINKAVASMERAKKQSQSLTELLRKVGPGIAAAFGGFAVLGSIRRFNSLIREGSQRVDDLAKQSDKLGVTTQNLQAIRLQAELTGTSVSSIEKAILTLSKNAGSVSTGLATATSTQAKAFDSLGISIQQINSLDSGQLFELVIDRLSGIDNQAQRTAIAMNILGRGGAEALNLISGGTGGLAKARNDIRDLGLEISRVDAAQVEIANDNLARLGSIASGVKDRFAIELAPAINAFTVNLLNSAKAGSGFANPIAKGVSIALTWLDRLVAFTKILSGSFQVSVNLIVGTQAKMAQFVAQGVNLVLGHHERVVRFLGDLFAPTFDAATDSAINALNNLLTSAEQILNNLIEGAGTSVSQIASFINKIITKLVEGVEKTINVGIQGVNKFIEASNRFTPIKLPTVSPVSINASGLKISEDFEKITIPKFKNTGSKVAKTFFEGLETGLQKTREGVNLAGDTFQFTSEAALESATDAAQKVSDAYNDLTEGSEFLKRYQEERLRVSELANQAGPNSLSQLTSNTLPRIGAGGGSSGGGGGGASSLGGSTGANNVEEGQNFVSAFSESIPTLDQNLQNLASGSLSDVTNGITGLVEGTETWGSAFLKTGQGIVRQLIQIGIQRTVLFLLGQSQQKTATTTQVSSGAQIAAAQGPAAILSSIASFGASSVAGSIAAIAAIGLIGAAIAGAFNEGGVVPGPVSQQDNRLALVASGERIIRNGPAQRHSALLEGINQGRDPLDILNVQQSQESSLNINMPERTFSDTQGKDGGSNGFTANLFLDPDQLSDAQESRTRQFIRDVLDEERTKLGFG